jgi:hypothetical protein
LVAHSRGREIPARDVKTYNANPGGQVWVSWVILDATEGANDGVVSVESARWGSYEGTLATDHLGEVGQILGITSGSFDQRSFYETWASTLEQRGFGP